MTPGPASRPARLLGAGPPDAFRARSARRITGSVATLTMLAALGVGLPEQASADVPPGNWAACADETDRYCIESAALTPVGGEPTALAELGLTTQVSMLISDNGVGSFNWAVEGWDGEEVGEDVRGGDVELVLRTGAFRPRYTTAIAKDLRVRRVLDEAQDATLTISGKAVQMDWVTGSDLETFYSCIGGTSCGDDDTMADESGTGPRFAGNTQNLETWDERDTIDGTYISTDAQSRPTMIGFGVYPEPYWSIPNLGNPHLDLEGNPVRGSFNAWLPPTYFDAAASSVEEALGVGFEVTSHEGDLTIPVAADVSEVDGGVMITVDDLGYSMANPTIYNRVPTSDGPADRPAPPTEVSAAAGTDGVEVTWTASEGDVTGYTVRAFDDEAHGSVVGRCTSEATNCTLTGLDPADAPLWVAVTASSEAGEGAGSARTAVETATVPDPPSRVTAAPGAGRATVGWDAPGSDGGSEITGYRADLYAAATGGTSLGHCTTADADETEAGQACTVTGLHNGTRYFAAVRATNAVGIGAASAPRVAVIPRTVPTAPRSVTATSTQSTVRAGWAAPASNGGSAVTGYAVTVFTTATGTAVATRCTATAAARSCTSPRLVVGRTYYVAVRARNAAGLSALSARVKVVVKR